MGALLLAACWLALTACSSRHLPGDAACPAQTWRDTAEIVRSEPAPPSSGADLGARIPDPYVVEFRIVGDTSPENSAVRRRTTPFMFTVGAGGLPSAEFVKRNGLTLGAKLPVIITEGFPEDRWTYCGGVEIRFEGLR